jgi:hypothetical protein
MIDRLLPRVGDHEHVTSVLLSSFWVAVVVLLQSCSWNELARDQVGSMAGNCVVIQFNAVSSKALELQQAFVRSEAPTRSRR